MRKQRNGFRQVLAWLLTLAMVIGMTPSMAFAEGDTEAAIESTWAKTTLDEITAEDLVAITMTTSDGTTYALPSATATNAVPLATKATVESDAMTLGTAGADHGWYITVAEDNSLSIKNAKGEFLYLISNNSGVRVNKTEAVWTVDATTGFLSTQITKTTDGVESTETRYLGVYTTKPDWRSYTSTNNFKGQTLGFWKCVGETAPDITKVTPTATYQGKAAVGTEMSLQCSPISDATYEISADETTWTAIEGNTYTIPEGEPGEYNLYIRGVYEGQYSKVLTISYTISDGTGPTASLATTLEDGDVVYIYSVSGAVVMTGSTAGTEAKPTLAASDAVAIVDNTLELDDTMLALQVEKATETTGEGDAAVSTTTYAFHTIDGRYLTSGATGSSLTLGAKTEYSLWTLEELAVNGVTAYTVKSVNAKYNSKAQALEFYKAFTTYTAASTNAFQIQFFKENAAEGITSIADARALAADAEATVKGTVVYISGKNVYVQDWTGGICLYFTTAPSDVKVGDIVEATGTKTTYKGLEELQNVASYTVVGTASALPCTNTTIADITADLTAGKLECTRVFLQNVTLGTINAASNTAITDEAGNTINIYKTSALAERKEGDVVNLYAIVSDFNGYQLFVTSASDVTLVKEASTGGEGESETSTEDPTDPSTDPTKLPATIADGTYVIWNPNYNITLANLFNGSGYIIGETISGTVNEVNGYSNASVWTVKAVDGGYTFEQNGKYVGTNSSGKLAIDAAPANTVWTVELTEDGQHYNLKCGGNYLEWYANYSDWSTYKYIKGSDAGLFQMWFTPAASVYDVDTEVEMELAQWGGGGPYATGITSINGDKFASGDQKDTAAVYTAVVSGKEITPFSSANTSTGGTNYYMGGAGLGSGTNDYVQLALSSAGYGNLSLSFRLRASKTGSGEFQMQYSTDGKSFKNLTTGTYSAGYTKYITGEDGTSTPTAVTLSGDITDGIAKTSIAATYYVSFTFDLPARAANADTLYIRMVPSTTMNAGGTAKPATGGSLRVDSVVIKGSPIVDDSITAFVTVDPDGVEEDQAPGTELTMTSKTEGATIQYRFVDTNGTGAEEWLTYAETAKPVLPATLPAVLQVKAVAEGKTDSIVRTLNYAAGSCASVKVSPNGGGIYLADEASSTEVTLSCDTEGATIYYSVDGTEDYKVYDPETTKITLTKGFEALTVMAYAVKDGFKDSAVTTRKFVERSQESYNIYFGQMHSHTSYSDGAGSADDAFKHASNVENLDFLAVTDHSNSFDNAGSGVLAEDASKVSEEWKEGKELAQKYTTAEFVGLFGFEMTWSNGLGHINTFNTPGFQSRTQSEYSTYSTALQNYYATLKTVSDSISQFNHPGTTFGDFSDFSYFDEELDQLITLIEVGNGEGTIGSSSYFPSYEYYTRALDKGWHVAPTNNQDNHKGLWGDANTARSVVLSDTLAEEDIYDAMRNYRVYATEDNDLSVYYALDGNIMGTILTKDDVSDSVTLTAKISDPTDSSIGKVEVIVNGGLSIASKVIGESSADVSFTVGADYSYYYLKITEADGDIAVTAPVWVGTVEAVGISSLSTSSALQVQGEEIDLTLDLYNNEKKPLEVTKVEISVMNADDETTTIETLEGDALTAAGIAKVAKLSTASYTTNYTYTGLGKAVYTVTVTGVLNGVEKVYSEKLNLNYVSPAMVSNVVVDGTHYNDYVTGYYGGNMGNFTTIAAQNSVKVTIAGGDKAASDRSLTEAEWKELLKDCSLLVVSAPARTSGTANAGDYKASTYEDWFLALVKDYVDQGGNVAVCGLADYQDKKASSTDNHCAAQQNKLLAAIGSTLKINDDEICDDTNNGGQNYRMYPESFNMESSWTAGLIDKAANEENYQKYSQYSGCSVDAGEGTWLVKGFDTTYSIDSDGDKIGGIAVGNQVNFLATEATTAGGNIFAAGGVFLSDFEIKVEMDNQFDLPYANKTIAENILTAIKKELPVTPISEVRAAANAGESGSVYRVKGTVTVGRSNENNAFFDCIYVQDETAGIDIFPISDDSIQVGASIEITGYIASYQGDLELKVMSYKLLDNENLNPIDPTKLTCKEASDYAANGGLLTKVEGKVKEGSLYYNADGTLAQFVVVDETGETTIFIDGYILSGTTGTNVLADTVKAGATVSAVGVQYMHPEVFIPGATENVSVLRVRDCDEIVVTSPAAELKTATIKASNVIKTLSSKTQYVTLKVTTNSDGKMTFSSSSKYVKVSSTGKVTIAKNYAGKAYITIRTAQTATYKAGYKKIYIKVKVPKTYIRTISNKSPRKVYVTWKKLSNVSGYQLRISRTSSFKSYKSATIKSRTKTSYTFTKNTKGKRYYVKVRAYKTVGSKRVYSSWSKAKSVIVKK